ncbi:MAP kinase-activating death domain protein, partial [Fasciolopsis buskii]
IYLFLLRTDLTDNVHGVHSGPQPEEVRERLQSLNLVEDQCQPDVNGVPEEELEETSVGRILLTNLSENLAEAASQATSTFSEFIDIQKNMVNKSKGFARKVVSELKQDGKHSSSDTTLLASGAAEQSSPKKRAGFFSSSKNLFGLSQNTTRNNSAVQESPPVPLYHTSPDQSIKDQEFLRAVVQMIKEGVGATYSIGSHLRELLTDENYRSYLISKVNSNLTKSIDDPELTVSDFVSYIFELPSEAVYKSFIWLAQCMIRGLEQTCTNHGIGGLASAMSLLEICHTYFVDLQTGKKKSNNVSTSGRLVSRRLVLGVAVVVTSVVVAVVVVVISSFFCSLFCFSSKDQKTIRKSRTSGPYRFVNGKLILCDGAQPTGPDQGDTNRTTTKSSFISSPISIGNEPNRAYLYEALVQPKQRSRLWDHLQFWEDMFFDTVAQERDMMGFDQAPMEMLEKFSNLTSVDRRVLQYQEDRLLATCLYNLIACMVLMQVDRNAIRTRVRRIQARCRLGSHFALFLSSLLDQLQYLEGNAIDLLPTVSRCSCQQLFKVHRVNENGSEDPKLFEIYRSCVILRDLTGAIIDRLDHHSHPGVMLSADESLVIITRKRDGVDAAESYQSDQVNSRFKTTIACLSF